MSTIFLDMDGVIADFFGGIEKKFNVDHWKSLQDRDRIFVDLRNTNFFNTLKIFPNTIELFDHVTTVAWQNEMEWGICSSPLRGDRDNSAYWKRVWLQDHLFMPKVENCIFTSNKHQYAWNEVTHSPNILIDDKPENITEWNKAGGIGIRFQANEDDLREYLFVELEKAIEQTRNR
jgi:5'(3')-deoxyribonucleotidase